MLIDQRCSILRQIPQQVFRSLSGPCNSHPGSCDDEGGPIFIRKYDENKKAVHLTYKSEKVDDYLNETLKRKLEKAELKLKLNVSFDKNYHSPKTKLVRINGINNRASFCPVILDGEPEAIQFAWNVGIGHSTGSGFGALY